MSPDFHGPGTVWGRWFGYHARCLADLRLRFLDAGGPFFDAIPFRASDYDSPRPIMLAIRRDGLVL